MRSLLMFVLVIYSGPKLFQTPAPWPPRQFFDHNLTTNRDLADCELIYPTRQYPTQGHRALTHSPKNHPILWEIIGVTSQHWPHPKNLPSTYTRCCLTWSSCWLTFLFSENLKMEFYDSRPEYNADAMRDMICLSVQFIPIWFAFHNWFLAQIFFRMVTLDNVKHTKIDTVEGLIGIVMIPMATPIKNEISSILVMIAQLARIILILINF